MKCIEKQNDELVFEVRFNKIERNTLVHALVSLNEKRVFQGLGAEWNIIYKFITPFTEKREQRYNG